MSFRSIVTPAPRNGRRATVAIAAVALAVVVAAGCAPAPPAATGAHPMLHPIAGRSSVVDTFGAPRSGGRSHAGQDIFAAKHTPVVAVADGKITSVVHSNGGLSGNYLQLTADDGWRYLYIHLNNDSPGTDDGSNVYERAFADGITKGQRVKAGEVIAYVGDSGNAESTSPHVHFEMKDPAGNLVNPYASIVGATRWVRGAADRDADAPAGALDAVARAGDGSVTVAGWAIDRHVTGPVKVSVYVAGNPVTTVTASASRPDIGAAFPGYGDGHGFWATGISAGPGTPVCAIAHSVGGGGGTRLGCALA